MRGFAGLAASSLVATGLGLAAPAVTPAGAQTPAPGTIEAVRLRHVATHNLASPGLDGQVKPRGQNGDVAVLGTTAFVGGGALFHGAHSSPGRICTDYGGVKVVDLSNPSAPVLRTTIRIEDTKGVTNRANQKFDNVSVSAGAVDALRINTPTFTGDVLAIATQRCEPSFFNGARIEFWDVTNPASPAKIGVFDPETLINPTPGATPATGAWGIFEDVRMFARGDRVYAVATTPFSIGNAHDASPFGDLRILDITDIRNPKQVGTFPPVNIGQDSVNGCRAFLAGRAAAPTPDGKSAILSFYDGATSFGPNPAAVLKIDLDNLPKVVPGTTPPQFNPSPAHWDYPPNPTVEGNAADVQPFTGPGGALMTFVSEDDLDPALTNVTITGPASSASSFRGCEILVGKKLYEFPGQQQAGPIAYVGRGCPATATVAVPDDYLADPSGKIAVVDSGGCTALEKLQRLIGAGGLAIMQSAGSEVPNTIIASGNGGYPGRPYLTIPQSGYDRIQKVPAATLNSSTFPTSWDRTTTSNVTAVARPSGRTDMFRFRSVADATDRVARGQLKVANRFAVAAGQAYTAGVFLEVQSIVSGTFRAAVVWYDAGGAALGESELASLTAVAARTRYSLDVTAPAGAVKGSVKFEWTGGAAEGTAFAESFAVVPVGLEATLKDNQGEWGAQRIIDFSRATPTEVGSYRSPTSKLWPPPDEGIYSPRLARMFGSDVAFTTWLSDGLRILDVSSPSAPREVGSFVPPAAADPAPGAGAGGGLLRGQVWPNKTLVSGVDILATDGNSCGLVVLSDINAGLHVLSFEVTRAGRPGGCGGYWSAASDGGVFSFGDATFLGSMGGKPLNSPVVGMAPTPSGAGYWLVATDGGVFSFGDAQFYGSTGAIRLNRPIVGMSATPSGKGYRLVASDGGVFAFGDAQFLGSTGALALNRPMVGMSATPSGKGYWLVASDGGIFAFGDAAFRGSTGALTLNKPVVGMAATGSGAGYWLVASDGGIFAFGDAPFHGSTGATRLNSNVVGMGATRSGKGYRLVAADGGVFAFGDASFLGSTGAIRLNAPVVATASFPR
ncbi:MAG: hypothetical protein ACT4PX_11140 [Actinomycetota bacterium]